MTPFRALMIVLVALALLATGSLPTVQAQDPDSAPVTLRIVTEQGPAKLAELSRPLVVDVGVDVQIAQRDPFGGRVNPLANQVADVLLTGMPLMKEEVMQVIEATGRPPICHVLVRDAVAMVVHRANEVDFITYAELRKIVAGEIDNWSQLRGGLDEAIIPLLPVDSADTSTYLWHGMLKGVDRSETTQSVAGGDAVARIEAGNEPDTGAFALVSNSMVTDQVRVMELAPAADKPGFVPNADTVGASADAERYPLTRVLFAWTLGRPQPGTAVKKWIDAMQSEEGQQKAVEAGYFRLR